MRVSSDAPSTRARALPTTEVLSGAHDPCLHYTVYSNTWSTYCGQSQTKRNVANGPPTFEVGRAEARSYSF